MKANDLTGKRFGKLTVLRRVENNPGKTRWVCRCDCGKEISVIVSNLTTNHTKSCGCYNVEQATINSTKHDMCGTRLYKIWQDMKRRCGSPLEKCFGNYGGRGVEVCKEWRTFKPFMEWALKNGYNDTLTIDRVDVNGNYEPNNCKWSTKKEQGRNKRNNFKIFYQGKTQPLSAWCEELNLDYIKTYMRLKRYNWSVEEEFGKA
jgi:hypothetical protein